MTPPASRAFPILFRILILAYAFNQFSLITADPDLWGHLKFGEAAWMQKALPATDPYSYTAQGLPWVNHEWLAEIIYYLIYAALGSTGLLIFKLALGLFILHLLSALYFARENNAVVYLLVFLLLAQVMAPGFMIRPHLFTFFFLTLLIVLLQKFFDGNHKALAWAPLLMLVWANCHGGVVAGIGIFGAVAVVEGGRCLFSGEKHGKVLLGYFFLSCLALLITPGGYKLWVFFFESLSVPRAIGEWNPVPLRDTSFLEFKILTALFVVSLFVPVKNRLWEMVIIGLAVVYAFKHQRHTVLAAIVMIPYLPLKMAELIRRFHLQATLGTLSAPLRVVLQSAVVILTVVNLFAGFSKCQANDFKILVEPTRYPTYAAQFMRANAIDGNLLVPFDWGEYFIWKLPQSRVSIDGRFRTVYPDKIIRQHQAFVLGQPEGNRLLDDYPTDLVIIRKSDPNRNFMDRKTSWRKIYEDLISKIYIRKTQPPGSVEEKFQRKELIDPKVSPPFSFPG